MNTSKTIIGFLTLLILGSCSITDKSERRIKYSIQTGFNKGGIIENTDLSVVPNINPSDLNDVDAFSGATKTGGNIGIHVNKPLIYGEVESGIDYMFNIQNFSYNDYQNGYLGKRDFVVNQFMIPLTYNFVLFKRLLPKSEIQIKIGYLGQFNLISSNGTGALPEFSINSWSNGAMFGFSAYPLKFSSGHKLGFFIDAYRGTQIYTDFYNQPSFEMPGSGFVKYGIRFRF